LDLSKGACYYEPVKDSAENLMLMRLIDEQYTKTPFYGQRRLTAHLKRMGYQVSRKRVRTLMRKMGIAAIYPKKNLSKKHHDHKIYKYLLRDLIINRPNMVWATDITYIRLSKGYMYLVAIIDWFSKYILSWKLNNSLEKEFCIECLEKALSKGKPEIFNTDQGAQFTSSQFTRILKDSEIKISMDGRGRALDNRIIERFWRSLKYEEVYLKDYPDVRTSFFNLDKYMKFYNYERLHQTLGYKPPGEVHIFN